jgi:Holliday junction resolvase RusA-like endonuclease
VETIRIKPLTVNQCFQGRHYITREFEAYREALAYLIPKPKAFPIGKLDVKYEFGVSAKSADGDNLIKAFQDCLAAKYGFNDRDIYHWDVTKVLVKKGEEYIKFSIKPNAWGKIEE